MLLPPIGVAAAGSFLAQHFPARSVLFFRPGLHEGPQRKVFRAAMFRQPSRVLCRTEIDTCVRTGLSNSCVISNCNLEEFSARSPRVIIPRWTTGSHSEASESATETSNVAPHSKTTSAKS